jgi:hypothetical protein
LAEIITRWPELAGISGIELAETESYQARLHRKKLQHETILRHILPISTEEHSRAHDLAHLQEEQQRALAAPEWSDTTARLRKIGAERDALALQLATIQQKVALVKPIQIATKAYLHHIHVEHDGRADGGPEDQALVNAIANEALTSLQAILSVSQIQIGLIIDQTSSGPSTVEIIQALTNLLDAVNSQIGELEDQVNHHQSSYDLMTKALLDELG